MLQQKIVFVIYFKLSHFSYLLQSVLFLNIYINSFNSSKLECLNTNKDLSKKRIFVRCFAFTSLVMLFYVTGAHQIPYKNKRFTKEQTLKFGLTYYKTIIMKDEKFKKINKITVKSLTATSIMASILK